MKRYETISAGELRKMHWKKCRLETDGWAIIEDWFISINSEWFVFIAHNNMKAMGARPNEMFWKEYAVCLYTGSESDDKRDSRIYNWIEIEEIMQEWDEVYVSDISEEQAIKNKDRYILLRACKNGYVCIVRMYEYCYKEWNTFGTTTWKYAVPIPQAKTLTIKTEDWQSLEISEEKARELWFIF